MYACTGAHILVIMSGAPQFESQMTSQHLALVRSWIESGVEPPELVSKLTDLGYTITRPTAHRLIARMGRQKQAAAPAAVPPTADVHRTTRRAVRALEATDGAPELKSWAMQYLNRMASVLDDIMDDPGVPPSSRLKAVELGVDIASQINGLAEVMRDD